jgi:hypothetical protein
VKLVLALTVVFRGIIAQVDLPTPETVAVIPNAPQHIPFMCVQKSDKPNPVPPPGILLAGDKACPSASAFKIDLRKLNVSFDGIDETKVDRTPEYEKHTLSLSRISSCKTLKKDVQEKKIDAGGTIDAYVEYPGGKLSVNDFFYFKGEVKDTVLKDPECYACSVLLTMKTKDATTKVILKDKSATKFEFAVSSGASMDIVNGPTSPVNNNHSVHHYNIFENCKDMPVPTSTSKPCGKKVCTQSEERAKDAAEKAAKVARPSRGKKKPVASEQPDKDIECTGSNFP